MYNSNIDVVFFVVLAFFWVVSFIAAFVIIRYAVRSNEIVSDLKAINEKQNSQIDLLLSLVHKNEI